MNKERAQELALLCGQFRNELIDLLHSIQTGHPGGSLSCTEIITTLYFAKMNIDPQNPKKADRDRFVLSKGHAAPILYMNLAHLGFFPVEELKSLRQIDSHLQGHPCAHKTPGIEVSTGPLGLGLSAGLGIALSAKLGGEGYYTYVLLGDGELQEGGIWEAAMSASKYGADHLIAIVDHNGVQLDGTNEEIMPMGDIAAKFTSFGWNVIPCDGHDIASFSDAVDAAKAHKGAPTVIIAETVKGKGVSFMEGKNTWHGKPINDAEYAQAKQELGGANE
ncbi:transketolase [Oscillospiraceae bacterium PP1C4]